MLIGPIDYPPELVQAIHTGKLVVFAGSGVSMSAPAHLPDFTGLAEEVALGSGLKVDSNRSIDRFLGMMKHKGMDVHRDAVRVLSAVRPETGQPPSPTPLHLAILRLFPDPQRIRIVTTNFESLFTDAVRDIFGRDATNEDIFSAPVLPRGRDFHGIVHLHGILDHPEEMILTDADLGRAYYGEGWARRYLIDLLGHCPVLYVGYSLNDPALYYITRAFTEGNNVVHKYLRWAFTPSDSNDEDLNHWDMLGVTVINFPVNNQALDKFDMLPQCINALAERSSWNLERWESEISKIASMPPPDREDANNTESVGLIEYALRDAVGNEGEKLTQFFTRAAQLPEWINWIDDIVFPNNIDISPTKYFDPLFIDKSLDKRYAAISDWLADNYAVNHASALLLILGKYSHKFNPVFWWKLANNIAHSIDISYDTLTRWVTILINNRPDHMHESYQYRLLELGKKCARSGAYNCLLDVFESMYNMKISIKRKMDWFADTPRYETHFDVEMEIDTVTHQWCFDELWNNDNNINESVRGHLDALSHKLLPRMIHILEKRHSIWQSWGKANRNWDSDSFRRSAIEPHEQDASTRESLDVIIDACRDCLDWIISNNSTQALAWRNWLSVSEAPILRRIALYIHAHDASTTPDDKIEWLLNSFALGSITERYEIFHVLENTYTKLELTKRKTLIAAIMNLKCVRNDETDPDETTDRLHYNILGWLDKTVKEHGQHCELVQSVLDPIRLKYPIWRLGDHLDLTHYSTNVDFVGHESPYSADELLASPPSYWLPKLLEYKSPDWPPEPNRDGMIRALSVVSKRNPIWGCELAKLLIGIELFKSDLWNGLFKGWGVHGDSNLSLEQFTELLDVIETPQLCHAQPGNLAYLLHSLVDNEGKPYALDIMPRTHTLALNVWNCLDRSQDSQSHDDWASAALNYPGGILAQYWIDSLSFWMRNQDPRPRVLPDEYREALTAIATDNTVHGRIGRPIIAMQYAWLYYLDENWTRNNLLPYFTIHSGSDNFKSIWQGFLLTCHIDKNCFESLKLPILNAIPHIHDDGILANDRERFMELGAFVVCSFAKDDIMELWIPTLLKDVKDESRAHFARKIGDFLQEVNSEHKIEWWKCWLKLFLQKRSVNIPSRLETHEACAIIEWIPDLECVLDDAIELIKKLPVPYIDHTRLINIIENDEDEIIEKHSAAIASLLLWLRNIPHSPWLWDATDIMSINKKMNKESFNMKMRTDWVEFMSYELPTVEK